MGKIATLALLLMLAVPAPAAAVARVVVPPGNSEADQYFQTVPTATGPRTPDPSKDARDAVRDGALSAGTERALRQRGPAGLALATAVAQTAGPRGGGASGRPARQAAVARIPGDPGMGTLFPLLLALTAAAALAFFAARRRGLVSR